MSTRQTPRYEVGKVREGKWAVYFRLDERTSFDEKVYHPTRRRALSVAAMLNADLAELQRQRDAEQAQA